VPEEVSCMKTKKQQGEKEGPGVPLLLEFKNDCQSEHQINQSQARHREGNAA